MLAMLLGASHASAHHFFVSITESAGHSPGSIATNIGWGHMLPMDDFFLGSELHTYAIYDPDMKKVDLPFSADANVKAARNEGEDVPDFPGGKILAGDSFTRKLFFKEDSPQGTYQVTASTNKIQFSLWTDKNGRQKWGRTTLDQIKDAQEIKICWEFQSFAKAFAVVGIWTEPRPVGHDLELIPLTDLTKVRVGDEVAFKVLLFGEPVQTDQNGLPLLEVYGEHYGADGRYGLKGGISGGIAKIRVTAPGRWLARVGTRKPVTKENGPAELVGKALEVGYNTTATFFVHQ